MPSELTETLPEDLSNMDTITYISEGGYGEVYLCETKSGEINKVEALKIAHDKVDEVLRGDDNSFMLPYLKEYKHANTIMNFNGRGLVSIHSVEQDSVLMEYFPGTSILEGIYEKPVPPPTIRTSFQAMLDLIQGLKTIHESGHLHGEVDVNNVMIRLGPGEGDAAKIYDYDNLSKCDFPGLFKHEVGDLVLVFKNIFTWGKEELDDYFWEVFEGISDVETLEDLLRIIQATQLKFEVAPSHITFADFYKSTSLNLPSKPISIQCKE